MDTSPSGIIQDKKFVEGPFSLAEVNFIKSNRHKTTKQIAEELGRNVSSVINKIKCLGIKKNKNRKHTISKKEKESEYLATLSDTDRRLVFTKEVENSARYRAIQNAFDREELASYVEKYVDFMMDPTIETMTNMEKDSLHQVFINEIRINRFLREEKDDIPISKQENRQPISRSREIKECQEIIAKYHKSLDIEREQRLKNQSDQSITFANIIRDLKRNDIRMKAGKEAAMLKYIAEKFYNDKIGKNIISGRSDKYNVDSLFKSGAAPNLSSEFVVLPEEAKDKNEPKQE